MTKPPKNTPRKGQICGFCREPQVESLTDDKARVRVKSLSSAVEEIEYLLWWAWDDEGVVGGLAHAAIADVLQPTHAGYRFLYIQLPYLASQCEATKRRRYLVMQLLGSPAVSQPRPSGRTASYSARRFSPPLEAAQLSPQTAPPWGPQRLGRHLCRRNRVKVCRAEYNPVYRLPRRRHLRHCDLELSVAQRQEDRRGWTGWTGSGRVA